ncbi:MAG: hypothetical protein RL199_1604, partial [Pseudomonadota bacterium]
DLLEIDLLAKSQNTIATVSYDSESACYTSDKKAAWVCSNGGGGFLWIIRGSSGAGAFVAGGNERPRRLTWSSDGLGVLVNGRIVAGVVGGDATVSGDYLGYDSGQSFFVSDNGRVAFGQNYAISLADGRVDLGQSCDLDPSRSLVSGSAVWCAGWGNGGVSRFDTSTGQIAAYKGAYLLPDSDSPRKRFCFTDADLHCVDGSGKDRVLANGFNTARAVNGSETLVLVNFDGTRGDLKLLDSNDSLVHILSGVNVLDWPADGNGVLAVTGLDLPSGLGALHYVDVGARTATRLADHVRVSSGRAIQQARAYFNGTDADGIGGFYVVGLDGNGLRRLGPESTGWSVSPDGTRAFFTAAGYTWAEDTTGGPSLVLEKNYSPIAASKDGRTLFFNATTDIYPDSTRNGSYRIDLP